MTTDRAGLDRYARQTDALVRELMRRQGAADPRHSMRHDRASVALKLGDPLSSAMVAALCTIAAHDGLHRFRTGYGLSRCSPDLVSTLSVAALAARGLVVITRGRKTPGAIGRATLTWRGVDRLVDGPDAAAAGTA